MRSRVVKLFRAYLTDGTAGRGVGTVVDINADGLHVSCHGGVVAIRELQVPGRKRVTAKELAAGRGVAIGDRLEKPPPPSGESA